jgi:hypothetical protein
MANKQVKLTGTSLCIACQREYPINRFYMKFMEDDFLPNHALPYCDECCEEIVRYYLDRTNSIQSAMWFTCAKLDIPFINDVFEAMIDSKIKYQEQYKKTDDKNFKFFKYYYDHLWGNKTLQKAGQRWECFADTDISLEEVTTTTRKDREIDEQIDKLKLEWGEQETIDDYRFLIYNYDKYTKEVNITSPQQEDLYRDLCLARLEKRKIEEKTLDGDLTKVQNRILNLMKKLNLDNFVDEKPKSLSERFLFEQIAKLEEHDVADFYKEPDKYKDFNKLRQYEKDMVLRPLLNSIVGSRDFTIDLDDVEKYNMDNEVIKQNGK